MDIYQESIELHQKLNGKLTIVNKVPIKNKHDLSLVYTPGVAEACRKIHENEELAFKLTIKKNSVAIFSDGSAVLGLGNIGPFAAIPVMEGKAMLFKEYADIDAFPICVKDQNTESIIETVKNISPIFGGINLEDISAPRCFEIEDKLQNIGIPVFHDDQHGTAIVVLAALINSAKLAKKPFSDLNVVINGAGAAGKAISDMLLAIGYEGLITPVKNVILCDTKGIISKNRFDNEDDNNYKKKLCNITNIENRNGSLKDALKGADVFIGVSVADVVNEEMIKEMNIKPILFPMANPIPEIMPDKAKKAGAFIIGTGRSDFPNQVNNVLAFPGIFRGALDAGAKRITPKMKISAALALAESVENPTVDFIIPSPLDKSVSKKVAERVCHAAKNIL